MRPEFDAEDAAILAIKREQFDALPGPRVGDFVRVGEGIVLRFTHDWGDTIQTTVKPSHPCNGDASFYLSFNGHVSFSGSLDSGIEKTKLRDTTDTEYGSFWFFHHNEYTAHNGVYFKIPCRVFEVENGQV